MSRTWGLVARSSILVASALLAVPAHAKSANHEIAVPDAVSKAFQAAFPRAEITKVDVEKEGGVPVYDFEFREGTLDRECDIAADGTILNTAVAVDPRSVPEAAMKSFVKAAGGGAVGRIERSEILADTKGGRIVKRATPGVEFEAEIEKAGRRGEVTVSEDGTVVEGPEWYKRESHAAGEKK